MAKKKLGIDIDGVLADTTSRWLQEAEKLHGIRAIKKDIVRYEISEVFTSLTRDEVITGFRSIWKDYETISLEDPDIPSIMDNLHDKFEIWITTANPSANIGLWLKKNNVPYDRLMQFSRHTDKHKLDNVGIYVDDFHEVIENVVNSNKIGILLRQPWNEEFIKTTKMKNMIVADNWRHIEEILLEKFA